MARRPVSPSIPPIAGSTSTRPPARSRWRPSDLGLLVHRAQRSSVTLLGNSARRNKSTPMGRSATRRSSRRGRGTRSPWAGRRGRAADHGAETPRWPAESARAGEGTRISVGRGRRSRLGWQRQSLDPIQNGSVSAGRGQDGVTKVAQVPTRDGMDACLVEGQPAHRGGIDHVLLAAPMVGSCALHDSRVETESRHGPCGHATRFLSQGEQMDRRILAPSGMASSSRHARRRRVVVTASAAGRPPPGGLRRGERDRRSLSRSRTSRSSRRRSRRVGRSPSRTPAPTPPKRHARRGRLRHAEHPARQGRRVAFHWRLMSSTRSPDMKGTITVGA
jgi:hypothetical protein